MVQSVANSNQSISQYGSIDKVGTNSTGRIVYQVKDDKGNIAGKISVSPKDADVFEKSYHDIMESAPKLQKYAENTTPEKVEKAQKRAKWTIGIGAFLGGIYPLLKVKGEGFWGGAKQLGLTLLGTAVGALAGMFVASKTTTPDGMAEFTRATKTISQLDIQPEK